MGNCLVKQSRRHRKIDRLLNVITETNTGLLDELYGCGLLNAQQYELLQNDKGNRSRASKLFTYYSKKSRKKQRRFLSVLDKTGQSHVANYIRYNGQRPTTDSDDWPVLACMGQSERFMKWQELTDWMDPNDGTLDELLSVCYISSRQKQLIAEQPTVTYKNNELVPIIQRKSVKDHKKLIDCLTKTKQYRAVWLLELDTSTSVKPVSDEHVNTLITNNAKLIELIDLDGGGLLAELLSADIITLRHKEHIESAKTRSKSISRLLYIVIRNSETNYLKFIECLRKDGQPHVADSVLRGGVVAEMVAQTSLSTVDEHHVVERFKNDWTNMLPDKKEPLRRKIMEIMSGTLQDNQLIAMRTNHSIKLFFCCTSLEGLQLLEEMRTTNQLQRVIEKILTVLLDQERSVTIHSLKWNTSDYNRCEQYLSSVSGLTVHSKLHQLAQQSHQVTTDSDHASHNLSINQLPHELLELVLLKTEGQLFATLNKLVSSAHIITMTTLHSVCLYWWETLTSRQKNRQLLINYYNQLCAPHKFNPKPVSSIRSQDYVKGVAELCSKLFIIVGDTLKVITIDGSTYCDLDERIKMSELRNPLDIVACRVTNCLYVSDRDTRCIWRLGSSSSFQDTTTVTVKKFIVTDYQPFTLSVQSCRLVVTSALSSELHVYSCENGNLIKKMGLSVDVQVQHTVETLYGTVITCDVNRFANVKTNPMNAPSVRKVSQDGRVIVAYKGPAMLTWPCYITTDCKNHFLVCDRDNQQIVLLNGELELVRIVLTDELRGQPIRACYSEDSGRLYVSYWYDGTVDVYRI